MAAISPVVMRLSRDTYRIWSLKGVVGTVEPIPLTCTTMNAQRRPDRVAELRRGDQILLRKHLDSLSHVGSLDGHSQAPGEVTNVESAVPSQQGFLGEDPQVASTPGFFERSLDTVLMQFPLKLEQVLEGIRIISIDRHPLAALRLGIDCI